MKVENWGNDFCAKNSSNEMKYLKKKSKLNLFLERLKKSIFVSTKSKPHS